MFALKCIFFHISERVSKIWRHKIYVKSFVRCENSPADNFQNCNDINSHFVLKQQFFFFTISPKNKVYQMFTIRNFNYTILLKTLYPRLIITTLFLKVFTTRWSKPSVCKFIKKHRENREKLPWEYLICCRGVKLFNRPGVAGAVLHTASSLIN